MGMQLNPVAPIDTRQRKQWQTARGSYATVNGARKVDLPKMPRVTYHDPAKPRELATIRAEFAKADLAGDPENQREHAARGQQVIPGWRIALTDGHFAWAIPGGDDRTPLLAAPESLGILPIAAWRDYAPVRHTVNERSRAITWEFSVDRVRWRSEVPDLGISYSWTPMAGELPPDTSRQIVLSDRYLWLCRGRQWHIGITSTAGGEGAIVLTDETATVALVVMGMQVTR